MTHRDTLHRLVKTRGEVLTDYEFRNVCLKLYGMAYHGEAFSNCLIRDASTDGAFLLQSERDSLLHVINGGSIDDVMGTDREVLAANHHGGGQPVVLLSRDDSER